MADAPVSTSMVTSAPCTSIVTNIGVVSYAPSCNIYCHPLILCRLLGCLAVLDHPEHDLCAVPLCSSAVVVPFAYSCRTLLYAPFSYSSCTHFLYFSDVCPVFSSTAVVLRHLVDCRCSMSSSPDNHYQDITKIFYES